MTTRQHALSPRQEQVLLLLGDGLGLGEIAARLGISEWTVRTYRDEGRRRLSARTTAHAAVLVRELRAAAPCPRLTVETSAPSEGRPETGHLRRRVTNSVTKVTNRATNTATRAPTGIGVTSSRVCAGADAVGVGRTHGSLVRSRPHVNSIRPAGAVPRPRTVSTADSGLEPRCD